MNKKDKMRIAFRPKGMQRKTMINIIKKEELQMKLETVIKNVETLLEQKQKNRTIISVAEESVFLCGAMEVVHSVFGSDPEKLDTIPPRWIFSSMSGRSINGFEYK